MSALVHKSRVCLTRSQLRMTSATLALLAVLLLIAHSLVRTHAIRSIHTQTTHIGQVSELHAFFYQTNIQLGSLVLSKHQTGIKILKRTGELEHDDLATDAALDDLLTSTMWAPIRRDDLLYKLIYAMQTLIPIAFSLLFWGYLCRAKRQLDSSNICLNCAYSLDGIAAKTCPECGNLARQA